MTKGETKDIFLYKQSMSGTHIGPGPAPEGTGIIGLKQYSPRPFSFHGPLFYRLENIFSSFSSLKEAIRMFIEAIMDAIYKDEDESLRQVIKKLYK
ncbi:hypothetical protein R6Q57_003310 [Mikania cordata]